MNVLQTQDLKKNIPKNTCLRWREYYDSKG